MPWVNDVAAILATFLPGEAGGSAVYDILTGTVNPSGKLPETFAKRLVDTPAYLHFPGQADTCIYGEGIFIGYRYYEKKQIEPLFPFGHGLSYTTFHYGAVELEKNNYPDNEQVTFTITITNTGTLAGKEIVQIYVAPESYATAKTIIRPVKELKAFQKVTLLPGETKTLKFTLDFRSFAWYDVDSNDWRTETGTYKILAAASSTDIRSEAVLSLASTFVESKVITRDTLMGEIAAMPNGQNLLFDLLEKTGTKMSGKSADKPGDEEAYMKMILSMPIKTLILIGMPAD